MRRLFAVPDPVEAFVDVAVVPAGWPWATDQPPDDSDPARTGRQWCAANRRWFNPSTLRGACGDCQTQIHAERTRRPAWKDPP